MTESPRAMRQRRIRALNCTPADRGQVLRRRPSRHYLGAKSGRSEPHSITRDTCVSDRAHKIFILLHANRLGHRSQTERRIWTTPDGARQRPAVSAFAPAGLVRQSALGDRASKNGNHREVPPISRNQSSLVSSMLPECGHFWRLSARVQAESSGRP